MLKWLSNMLAHKKYTISLIAILLAVSNAAYGIGLSPIDIIADDILPHSSVTKELYISRGDASTEESVVVTIAGTAAPYIKTPLGSTVTLPVGEQIFAYPLVIEPGSLADGTYKAKITAAITNPDTTTTTTDSTTTVSVGTTILSGAQSTLIFTITNDAIEQYTITSVEMAPSEENQLIGFSYSMSNTGNVDTRPAKIKLTITDELDNSNSYNETILGDQLAIVPAFTDQVVTVSTKARLITGLYAINLTFYNTADEVVYTNDALRLQIFPEGTLEQKGELVTFVTDKTTYQVAEPVILTAHFQNTGNIGVNATLIVEILNDGIRLDILKNEPIYVPIRQTASLEQTFKPATGGSYTAVGYVNYGIFTTEKIEVEFTVDALSNILVALFISFILLAAGGVTFWFYRYKRKNFLLPSLKKK